MKHPFFLVSLIFALAIPAFTFAAGGPVVGTVSPLSAIYNVPQTYTVTAEDVDGVESCTLVVSSIYETPMAYNSSNGDWEVVYTFSTDRIANSIRAYCLDSYGNKTTGKSRILSVAGTPMETPTGTPSPVVIDVSEVDATAWTRDDVIAASPVLIKTACPGGEDFTHPCRTVYFLDNNGLRHAFPNEKVYFTWYADYTDLHLVTAETMASFDLGKNITYHPGTKLVKYPTADPVYAVEKGGVLHALASEEVAAELYGTAWNKQVDDVSESFYSNYTYGDPIVTHADFDVAVQTQSVDSINDNL